MHDIEVEYVTFPGWRGRSTSECRTFNSLPHNARLYVQFIEQFLGVPGLFNFLILKKENNFHFLFINSEMDWCW
jgi:adenylosuccinate synthase